MRIWKRLIIQVGIDHHTIANIYNSTYKCIFSPWCLKYTIRLFSVTFQERYFTMLNFVMEISDIMVDKI